jgi:hypothetical protein
MRKTKIAAVALCLGLLSTAFSQSTKADERDKKTVVSFSEPVEIPGSLLPPGTYVFKLANSDSDRHIVQIFSADERHVYATLLAIPDERLETTRIKISVFPRWVENKIQKPLRSPRNHNPFHKCSAI